MEDIFNKIYNMSLEEIMGERFGAYSKYIIQDRAIPDVRDGLKPVQRRILYAMSKDNNTYDKKFKKCANAVGIVLGKYHPHGDTSVYEALIRLSQDWKQNHILVQVDGNNGSIDGDGPAAYRYTECRLSKISEELLGDVDKFEDMKINFAPNFDDTKLEPTVLPARLPNLLVNGCTGISAGYATNMPPHNLNEICDAVIKRIDSPNCTLDTIMSIVKGPDFPTGGIVEGKEGLKKAYETGRGKIVVRCKYEFIKEKGKDKIVIDEIPFDVNKSHLVEKIDEIRIDKKIDGIAEVRDESDKDANIRIVIDLKTGANKELVMNYLLKNTELQTTYNYNNVTIVNRRPKLLGIIPIIDAYLEHRRFTVKKVSEFDLKTAQREHHIMEGLIKAISILDEVIATIRASKNKANAKENLVDKYAFTEPQAEAIVMLQLYKLTNTDIITLQNKMKELEELIQKLEDIIENPEKLDAEIKKELKSIKKEYGVPRKTVISDTVTEIKIDAHELIADERVIIVLSVDGYLKRVSMKSFTASNEPTGLKPGDSILNIYEASTLDKIMILTEKGNYLYIPVYQIPEAKWKEMGKHISNIVTVGADARVISSCIINATNSQKEFITITKMGNVKKTKLDLYNVSRYNKEIAAIKLRDGDLVVGGCLDLGEIILTTKNGLALRFKTSEIPTSGVKTSGVKGISLKDDDEVINGECILDPSEYLGIFTDKKTAKRIKLSDIEASTRARRGTSIIKKVKSTIYNLNYSHVTSSKTIFNLKFLDEVQECSASSIPIMDLSSTGSSITKKDILNVTKEAELEVIEVPSKANEKKEDENQFNAEGFLEEFRL